MDFEPENAQLVLRIKDLSTDERIIFG